MLKNNLIKIKISIMESCAMIIQLKKEQSQAARDNKTQLKIEAVTEKVMAYLTDFFRRDKKNISIEEKINFTAFVIHNWTILIDLNDFYEEECQLAIINWVVDNRKQLALESNYLSLALLYNLIIILEIFPIKTTDFISLKIIEKLKSIKRSIKLTRFEYAVRIQALILFWEEKIREIKQAENTKQQFLKKKTMRDNNDNNYDYNGICWKKRKGNCDEGISAETLLLDLTSPSSSSGLTNDEFSENNNKKKEKRVKWRENIVEEVVLYSIDIKDNDSDNDNE